MALALDVLLQVWNENMSNILVRLLCNQDCRDVYEWRNDENTRKMSLNSDFIDYDHHKSWFSNMLGSHNYVGIIGETNSEKIGIVHFRENDEEAFVSINLNPNFRGRGLSSQFLAKSLDFYLTDRQNTTRFLAEIKCDNIKSERIFKNNNFAFYFNHDDVNTFMRVNFINKGWKNV